MQRFASKSLVMLLVVITSNFCAYKKDNMNSTNTSIEGTWQLTHYHEVSVDSTTSPVTFNQKDTNFELILKFNSDGSAVSYNNTLLNYGNLGGYSLYGNDSVSFVFGPGPSMSKAKYTIKDIAMTFFTPPHFLYDSLHYYFTTETYIRLK